MNYPQNICDSGVVSANLSDHELVIIVSERSTGGKLPLNSRPLGTMLIIIRVIYGGTLKVLLGTLFLLPSQKTAAEETPDGPPVGVNDLWADFKRAFVMVADRHAPVIQKRVRGVDNCPWLNRSIKL